MKKILSILTLPAVIAVVSCTKGGALERGGGNQYTVTSVASAKQLIPSIDTTSTATFTGFYDEQLNILSFNVAWNDLWRSSGKDTISSVNFYGPASVTTNGSLIRSVPFVSANSAASVSLGLAGTGALAANEKNNLLQGACYFTINTKKYPGGIVRGQLMITKQ